MNHKPNQFVLLKLLEVVTLHSCPAAEIASVILKETFIYLKWTRDIRQDLDVVSETCPQTRDEN